MDAILKQSQRRAKSRSGLDFEFGRPRANHLRKRHHLRRGLSERNHRNPHRFERVRVGVQIQQKLPHPGVGALNRLANHRFGAVNEKVNWQTAVVNFHDFPIALNFWPQMNTDERDKNG
jgi:hypothetical protein